MAYNDRNSGPRISNDRFGNPFQLKFAPEAWNKKEGQRVSGVYKTYFELGGKLYKVEASRANKTKEIKGETVNGAWIKITAVQKRAASGRSM